jgi:hypothetical protein
MNQSSKQLSARWCPLCGTQHAVAKGQQDPWRPHITRKQIEALPALYEVSEAAKPFSILNPQVVPDYAGSIIILQAALAKLNR